MRLDDPKERAEQRRIDETGMAGNWQAAREVEGGKMLSIHEDNEWKHPDTSCRQRSRHYQTSIAHTYTTIPERS
jgi:hypothetical protein